MNAVVQRRVRCLRTALPIVVASLLSGVAAFAADTLPKAMLGAWASDPAACGEQASELALTVEPRNVLFYEHGNSVNRIVKQKDGSLKAYGYSFDDQGRARGSITLKLLSPEKLEVNEQIYHRCKP